MNWPQQTFVVFAYVLALSNALADSIGNVWSQRATHLKLAIELFFEHSGSGKLLRFGEKQPCILYEKVALAAKDKIIPGYVIAARRKALAFGLRGSPNCEVIFSGLSADDYEIFFTIAAIAELESFPMENAARQYGVIAHAESRSNSLRYSNSSFSIFGVSEIIGSDSNDNSGGMTAFLPFPPSHTFVHGFL